MYCQVRNARLDKSQAGIKIARRNINNLRYADDTTPMAENKEKPKSFFLEEGERGKKKEGEKAGLKLNIQNMKITAFSLLYGPTLISIYDY